jgi:hypothetical protein
MVATFWISYKFLADEDNIYACDLAYMLKINTYEFLAKEREVLLFINYNLFKLLKVFDEEETFYKEEKNLRASI